MNNITKRILAALGSLALLAATHSHAESFRASPGLLEFLNGEGQKIGEISYVNEQVPKIICQQGDYLVVADGTVITNTGEIVQKLQSTNHCNTQLEETLATIASSEVVELFAPGIVNRAVPTLTDHEGNFWVINIYQKTPDQPPLLRSRHFDQQLQKWSDIEIITPENEYVPTQIPPKGTIDKHGNIWVAYQQLSPGGDYDLHVVRHDTELGWQPPQKIYSSKIFWQVVHINADSTGNVMVVFNKNDQKPINELWMMVYDPTQEQWSHPKQVSDVGQPADIRLSKLLGYSSKNKTVDPVLVYLVNNPQTHGIYAQFWDPSLQVFKPATLIAGTQNASFPPSAGPVTELLSGINQQGEILVLWENITPTVLSKLAVYANYYKNGEWSPAEKILPSIDGRDNNIHSYSSISPGIDNSFLTTISREESDTDEIGVKTHGIHYTGPSQWQTEVLYSSWHATISRQQAAFYTPEKGAAVFMGFDADRKKKLLTIPYSTQTGWDKSALKPAPMAERTFFPILLSGNESLMLLNQTLTDAGGPTSEQVIKAAKLADTHSQLND